MYTKEKAKKEKTEQKNKQKGRKNKNQIRCSRLGYHIAKIKVTFFYFFL